jgi:thiol-disulfide isomerase/thioredoxin
MDQPSTKLRMAAMAATVMALVAISIPFVWQHDLEAERSDRSTAMSPVASHDAAPASAEVTEEAEEAEQDGAACMANAKPANYNFTVKDLDGKQVPLATFKGKTVLLNFWATWCGPCKAEIPGFVELQAKYRDQLTVIGYSVDDDAPKARAFAQEYKMNYPILLGEGREDVQDAFGPIWGIPASFLISKDGKICKKHLGIAPKNVFDKEIAALLASS